MTVCVGADHAGFLYKEAIKQWLVQLGYTVVDVGTHSEESVDYPDFGVAAARVVASAEAEAGIILCGSGIGISIAANKVSGIRAANVTSVEMARLAREHNNANMLALGSRITTLQDALAMVNEFLTTSFMGGRHERRVEKIDSLGDVN